MAERHLSTSVQEEAASLSSVDASARTDDGSSAARGVQTTSARKDVSCEWRLAAVR